MTAASDRRAVLGAALAAGAVGATAVLPASASAPQLSAVDRRVLDLRRRRARLLAIACRRHRRGRRSRPGAERERRGRMMAKDQEEPRFRIADLVRDPALRKALATAEDELGPIPALPMDENDAYGSDKARIIFHHAYCEASIERVTSTPRARLLVPE